MKTVTGNLVDLYSESIYPVKMKIDKGLILSIEKVVDKKFDNYIIPGFVDSHVHIESSMLMPQEFSKLVVPRGTIAVVTDPHEIANVMGVKGILAMVKGAQSGSCKIYFTIPSCVPATSLDGSGAVVNSQDVEILAKSGNFVGLSEVMDVFAVINGDEEMCKKLQVAKNQGLVIDGHAPLLDGENLKQYIANGVSTDHESILLSEALEKVENGMKILIRHGSAANNYEGLKELIKIAPNSVMFCTDDSHPDTLIKEGSVDRIVRDAVRDGYNLFHVLKAASINPINHYSLPVGTLKVGDSADFQVVKSLKTFKPVEVYIGGKIVYKADEKFDVEESEGVVVNLNLNKFNRGALKAMELRKPLLKGVQKGIQIIPNQLVTELCEFEIEHDVDNFEASLNDDILKIVYLNRYSADSVPQISYVQGFGIKSGAIASTVAHDSHNIMAVGTNDADLLKAINKVIEYKGGLVYCKDGMSTILPLPIGGIMSDRSGEYVNKIFTSLKRKVKREGAALEDPFMTLSFLSLIVIPEIKIGERGLFDFKSFSFIENC